MALVKVHTDMTQLTADQKIFVGHIVAFPDITIPTGYLKCNGAAISRTTYVDLFNLIGTTFGVGDTTTTFNLPDFRAEFVRGFDDSRGIDIGRSINSSQTDQSNSFKYFGTSTSGSATTSVSVLSDGTLSAWMGYYWDNDGMRLNNSGNDARPRNRSMMYCIRY
jgi:microcystin-dependent protein